MDVVPEQHLKQVSWAQKGEMESEEFMPGRGKSMGKGWNIRIKREYGTQ